MFGSYTAFEVEAERRREVLADSMRDSRRTQQAQEIERNPSSQAGTSDGRRLVEVAASFLNRVGQRV